MASTESLKSSVSERSFFRNSVRNTERTNLKILSLDGGGIRGLSSLMILEDIFDRLNARRQELNPELPRIEPCDYFDLIGGTSTGGILALMLGRLRMSIKQCKEEYLRLGKEVFVPTRGFGRGNRFDARKLENVLTRIISRELTSREGVPGRGNAPLLDPRGESCCKTIVFTVSQIDASPSHAVSLRTYHSTYDKARPFTIWEAARATSAAPTFFEPLVVPDDGNSEWVDGGLNVNNPADQIYNEVKQIWGEHNQRFDLDRIGLFLTLGTGIGGNISLKGGFWNDLTTRFGMPETLIKGIVKSKFDTETPNQRLLSIFNETPQTSKAYYRFNVESSLRDIAFFAYKRVTEIKHHTLNYLQDQRTLQHLNHCVLQAFEVLQNPSTPGSPRPLSEQSITALVHTLKEDPTLLKPIADYDDSKYFYQLTVEGMEIYDAIYARLPKDAEGYVRFNDFDSSMSSLGPTSKKLEQIWTRLRGGLDARMPRNMVLSILYMAHVECFDGRFDDHRPIRSDNGLWDTTDARFRVAQSFGNWVECRFHKGGAWCGRSWSYANNQWGLCKGLATDVECDLWQFYEGRLKGHYDWSKEAGFYKVTVYSGNHEDGRAFRDECRREFQAYRESFKRS